MTATSNRGQKRVRQGYLPQTLPSGKMVVTRDPFRSEKKKKRVTVKFPGRRVPVSSTTRRRGERRLLVITMSSEGECILGGEEEEDSGRQARSGGRGKSSLPTHPTSYQRKSYRSVTSQREKKGKSSSMLHNAREKTKGRKQKRTRRQPGGREEERRSSFLLKEEKKIGKESKKLWFASQEAILK